MQRLQIRHQGECKQDHNFGGECQTTESSLGDCVVCRFLVRRQFQAILELRRYGSSMGHHMCNLTLGEPEANARHQGEGEEKGNRKAQNGSFSEL